MTNLSRYWFIFKRFARTDDCDTMSKRPRFVRPSNYRVVVLLILPVFLSTLTGCFGLRWSKGGGQTSFTPPRAVNPGDVALPAGYRIEPVVTGLTFPSGVAFDEKGHIYVTESGYSYGETLTTAKLLRIHPDGKTTEVARGQRNGPWNGVAFHHGHFYVADGGEFDGGRILRIAPDGTVTALVEGLPSFGDHHTNGPAVGPDGWLYFGQGTATNSAVVGEDNAKFGWMKRHPRFHDIPCVDITLNERNFSSDNVLNHESTERVETGAFLPFGTKTAQGQIIEGRVPCNGSVMRIPLKGGKPELVAWGFRNPFGLAFSADGRLFVTDNSYDDRGSRPIHGAGDLLWPVMSGVWYGWSDFHGSRPVENGDHFIPPGKSQPEMLLAVPPGIPPDPAAVLDVHSSSNGFDFSRSPAFGYIEDAFIAQFGDMAPSAGKVLSPVGFKVVRVNVNSGVVVDFAVNKGKTNGPASWMQSGGLERPIAARFDPSGSALYIVDFGVMTMTKKGPEPKEGTGVLWKITRTQ